MNEHDVDPSEEKYLEMDRKVGRAEYALIADLAETDKALDEATEKPKKEVRKVRGELKRKAARPSPKD